MRRSRRQDQLGNIIVAKPVHMENEIWLLADLMSSQKKSHSLFVFLKAVDELKKGASLFTRAFHENFPELSLILQSVGETRLRQKMTELIRSVENGGLLLYPGHAFYPTGFYQLEDLPYLLRVRGSPVWLSQRGIAVVGSREPSVSSRQWIEEQMSLFLRTQSVYTVSGGARGVDQAIHDLSLRLQVPTVVVLPSGLGHVYPSSLFPWLDMIVEQGGAIISEYDDSVSMKKHLFHQRNRLIPALSLVTLVIDAKIKSGTVMTAHQAMNQGRPLWVLPSHPLDLHAQGGLQLLFDGAQMIRDAQDLNLLYETEFQYTLPKELNHSLFS
jgi:DNA processing protein